MADIHSDSTDHCQVCLQDSVQDRWFALRCGHGFCLECVLKHIQVSVDQKGMLPACPLSVNKCQHRISEDEFEECIVRSGLSMPSDSTKDIDPKDIDPKRTLERFRLLEQQMGLKEAGAFPCICCPEWMVPTKPGAMEHVACPNCAESFCAQCRRRPFHYHCACEELDDICATWKAWAKGNNVVLHDLDRRMKENDDMEKWKEKNCRLCPKCKRAIEKTGGCAQMVCGRNTEGKKNVQDGCGHKFTWGNASLYEDKASNNHLKALAKDALKVPDGLTSRAESARWPVSEELGGVFERCEICEEEVVGPRFDCINCPCLVVCSKCVCLLARAEASVASTSNAGKQKVKPLSKAKVKGPKAKVKSRLTARARVFLATRAAATAEARTPRNQLAASKSVDAFARATAQGHRQDHVFRIRWREPGPNEARQQSPTNPKGKKREVDVLEHDELEQLSPRELKQRLKRQLKQWGQSLLQMKRQLRTAGVRVTGTEQQQVRVMLRAMGANSTAPPHSRASSSSAAATSEAKAVAKAPPHSIASSSAAAVTSEAKAVAKAPPHSSASSSSAAVTSEANAVANLCQMGFGAAAASEALRRSQGAMEDALELLLRSSTASAAAAAAMPAPSNTTPTSAGATPPPPAPAAATAAPAPAAVVQTATADAEDGETGMCVMCLDNPVDSAVVPCGHMCGCNECLLGVQSSTKAECPMCRGPVSSIIKIFKP